MNAEINYTGFSVEDFIWNTDFRQWVLEPDGDSDIFWGEWLQLHPEKEQDIKTAKEIIWSVKVKNRPLTDLEISLAIDYVREHIKPVKNPATAYRSKSTLEKAFSYISIAASIAIIISVAFWIGIRSDNHSLTTYKDLVQSADERLIEKINTSASPMMINLEDGSKITLEKNAKISLTASFKNYPYRKVYLSGEASFEIAKDPSKPFFVYANGLVTKVLGTKFKIRSYDSEKKATVEVSSGIVAVFSFIDKRSQDENHSKKLNSLILTRNQKANYSDEDKTLMAAIVDKPVVADEKKINYSFTEAPLGRVFRLIQQGYGIDVIYDEKALAERTFTANLQNETLYQKLDIVCKTIDAHYEVIDGKIVIYAENND